jgi:hypothetical protein
MREPGTRAAVRRSVPQKHNKPYVEYTRNLDDERPASKRPTARKSTAGNKKPDVGGGGSSSSSSGVSEASERWDLKGTVSVVDIADRLAGLPYTKHQGSILQNAFRRKYFA